MGIAPAFALRAAASLHPSYTSPLFPHRHPNLQPAIAGERIEVFVVALEVGRVGCLQARRRQPLIPDRVDGAANGGDVVAMAEHRVALFGDPHTGELAWQVGKVRHFDTGDVVEIAGIVAVAADAVSDLADPAGNILDRLMKALPLAGNGGAGFAEVTLAEASDQKRLADLETRRLKLVCGG